MKLLFLIQPKVSPQFTFAYMLEAHIIVCLPRGWQIPKRHTRNHTGTHTDIRIHSYTVRQHTVNYNYVECAQLIKICVKNFITCITSNYGWLMLCCISRLKRKSDAHINWMIQVCVSTSCIWRTEWHGLYVWWCMCVCGMCGLSVEEGEKILVG